jgi:hypothetical protein
MLDELEQHTQVLDESRALVSGFPARCEPSPTSGNARNFRPTCSSASGVGQTYRPLRTVKEPPAASVSSRDKLADETLPTPSEQ